MLQFLLMYMLTGFPGLLESPGIFCKSAGKSWIMVLVLESPGNLSYRSWKVLEFAGTRTQWCRCENILIRTPLVLMIRSYSDKTFFFTACIVTVMNIALWILVRRVSNCCLCLYLHVAEEYDGVLENTFGVLKKSWNLFWTRQWEPSVNIGVIIRRYYNSANKKIVPKHKLQFPGNQISWVSGWVCDLSPWASSAMEGVKETKFGTKLA